MCVQCCLCLWLSIIDCHCFMCAKCCLCLCVLYYWLSLFHVCPMLSVSLYCLVLIVTVSCVPNVVCLRIIYYWLSLFPVCPMLSVSLYCLLLIVTVSCVTKVVWVSIFSIIDCHCFLCAQCCLYLWLSIIDCHCILCAQCCMCLFIVYYWLSLFPVCPMLSVSLDCLLLIVTLAVFYNVYLWNKSWKLECALSFDMVWRILVFYPESDVMEREFIEWW